MRLDEFCKQFVKRNQVIHVFYVDKEDKSGPEHTEMYEFKQLMEWETREDKSNFGSLEVVGLTSTCLDLIKKIDHSAIQIEVSSSLEGRVVYETEDCCNCDEA